MRIIASCLSSLLLVGLAAGPAVAAEPVSPVPAAAAAEVASLLQSTGLTAGQLVPARGVLVTPVPAADGVVERVEFVIDGQVAATVTNFGNGAVLKPPAGYNGDLTITVKAYDQDGNVSEQVVTVLADTVAPVATMLTPTTDGTYVTSPTNVVVTSADSDIDTIFGQDGITLTQIEGTTRWAGKLPVVNGTIAVVVRDRAGNDTTLIRPVVLDNQGPFPANVTPVNGTVVRGDFVTSIGSATDPSGVEKVELAVNGAPVGTATSAPYTIPVTGAPNGSALLVWTLTDTLGNKRVVNGVVKVDTEGPTATGYRPAHKAHVGASFYAQLLGVTDVVGFASVELSVNGKSLGSSPYVAYAFPVTTGGANGYVSLTWKVTDKFGNSRIYNQLVIADNTGPTITITKAPANKAKVKGTVNVSLKATDFSGISRVEMLVNGKVVARDTHSAYLLSVNTAKQSKTMKIQIRAYDKMGNVRYASTRTWYRK
ncbi:Ig-like domain-containing protein [Actinoplanes sp. L3-i22]|uniref:Ig-like domain-containing protein n=1 Tax=Actinoplanes sp. L3-i22 TaxID=2836373 RepID=UPI001C77E03C|nr:Ig-like domain-containing protein [Actinoplanes sp. L3-i22]BCY04978.1 hypothetical protein L3i22_000660 [Actinoplanes sp. L3-i22]